MRLYVLLARFLLCHFMTILRGFALRLPRRMAIPENRPPSQIVSG